jgi:hypothetical protein
MNIKDEKLIELEQANLLYSEEIIHWKSQCSSLESILSEYQSILGRSTASKAASCSSENLATPKEQNHFSMNTVGGYTVVSPSAYSEQTKFQEFRISRHSSPCSARGTSFSPTYETLKLETSRRDRQNRNHGDAAQQYSLPFVLSGSRIDETLFASALSPISSYKHDSSKYISKRK